MMEGELWLLIMWQSAKARDLLRDPRILVHNVITSRDGAEGEFKVRGAARAVTDPGVQRRYAGAVSDSPGWTPQPGQFRCLRPGELALGQGDPLVVEGGGRSGCLVFRREAGVGGGDGVGLGLRQGEDLEGA